jgi:hypothetical protein
VCSTSSYFAIEPNPKHNVGSVAAPATTTAGEPLHPPVLLEFQPHKLGFPQASKVGLPRIGVLVWLMNLNAEV